MLTTLSVDAHGFVGMFVCLSVCVRVFFSMHPCVSLCLGDSAGPMGSSVYP